MNLLNNVLSSTIPITLGEGAFLLAEKAKANPLARLIPKDLCSSSSPIAATLNLTCQTVTRVSWIYAITIASSAISEATGLPALEFSLEKSLCSSLMLDGLYFVGSSAIKEALLIKKLSDNTIPQPNPQTVPRIADCFQVYLGEWERKENNTIWVGEIEILTVEGHPLDPTWMDDSSCTICSFDRYGQSFPCLLSQGKVYCPPVLAQRNDHEYTA